MNRHTHNRPTGKHFKAAVSLQRELLAEGVLSPNRAAELVQRENKDLEGLLWMRPDGEWGLTPQVRKALRKMTKHLVAWDRATSQWLIPDIHRQKATRS